MAGNPCKAACVWTSAGWNREGWGHQDRADCPPRVASSKKFAWHVPDHGEPGVWGFCPRDRWLGQRVGLMGNPGHQHVAIVFIGCTRFPLTRMTSVLQPTWGFCWEKPAGFPTSVPNPLVNLVQWTSRRRTGGRHAGGGWCAMRFESNATLQPRETLASGEGICRKWERKPQSCRKCVFFPKSTGAFPWLTLPSCGCTGC